ncbi:MAG: DUF4446 family protein [Chthonomonadales bacterium]|nr:DUF4446 family protein [Chthonomonadales bacterium]
MNGIIGAVGQNTASILLAVIAVMVAIVAWQAILHRRLEAQRRVFARLTQGVHIGNLEEVLLQHVDELRSYADRIARLETHADATSRELQGCVQHIGVVRFDAFDDVGGQQSFACALLDRHRNGVVISGIYARSDLRVYAKRLDRGVPNVPLTKEETEAVAQAAAGPAS